MSEYWPDDIDLSDIANPLEILKEAGRNWAETTGGIVELLIQTATSTNKNEMLLVHGKYVPTGRTVSLFSVVYRPGSPYPARLQLDDDAIPDLLKKSYYQPGAFAVMSAISHGTEGRQVTNKWVCDVPSEFRAKLRDAFNDAAVKTRILNLIAAPKQVEQPESNIEPQKES